MIHVPWQMVNLGYIPLPQKMCTNDAHSPKEIISSRNSLKLMAKEGCKCVYIQGCNPNYFQQINFPSLQVGNHIELQPKVHESS